jgi:hypothetical protein
MMQSKTPIQFDAFLLPFIAFACLWILSACGTGTLSSLRPADTLDADQLEISGAMTNQYPLIQFNYGILQDLELCAHFEYSEVTGGARWRLLSSERDGLALTLGLYVGTTNDLTSRPNLDLDYLYSTVRVWIPQITVGKKIDRFEPYLGYKPFFTFQSRYQAGTYKVGTRYRLGRSAEYRLFTSGTPHTAAIFLMAELGWSQQRARNSTWHGQPEGAVGIAFQF